MRRSNAASRSWELIGKSFPSISLISLILLGILIYRGSRLTIEEILPSQGRLLRQFLIPRPIGSKAHQRVQNIITNHFRQLGWIIELDSFVKDDTLIGPVKFTNIIATSSKSSAESKIVLACHYDSKRLIQTANGEIVMDEFIGATDSAWSCAFLLHLASDLNHHFLHKKSKSAVQIIFFDGEEPLGLEWTDRDSIYGSRHLAELWSEQNPQALKSIKMFVLLDLLGAAGLQLANFFPQTLYVVEELVRIEGRLRQQNRLKTGRALFRADTPLLGFQNGQFVIGDDHVPFAEKGIPIVHLIPWQFPAVWHTMEDNADILDPSTCHDLALILKTFIITAI